MEDELKHTLHRHQDVLDCACVVFPTGGLHLPPLAFRADRRSRQEAQERGRYCTCVRVEHPIQDRIEEQAAGMSQQVSESMSQRSEDKVWSQFVMKAKKCEENKQTGLWSSSTCM